MIIFEKAKSWILVLALATLFACTMRDYGLSWDEPTRWKSGDVKLDYYIELLSSDNPLGVLKKAPRDLYPGLYDLPLALLRRYSCLDPFLLSRVFNCLFAFLALTGTFRLASVFSGSVGDQSGWLRKSQAYVAAAMLVCIPEFYGHMFINPKDIPFAATYAWALYGVIRWVASLPTPNLRRSLISGVLVGLCMAMRPPGVVVFAYVVAAAVAFLMFCAPPTGWIKLAGKTLLSLTIIGIAALITLLPWWPAAHRNPFSAPLQAVDSLHTFSSTIPLLFRGEIMNAGDAPWYYVLWMFVIKVPLWVQALVLLAGSSLWISRKSLKAMLSSQGGRHQIILWGMVIGAVVIPMVYVVWKQPAIHNGFRHMLYVLPPIAVIATHGWLVFYRWALAKRRLWLAHAASASAIIYTASVMIQLHPYQYVYYNELIGGAAGSLNRYETEYWFTSGTEGILLIKEIMRSEGDDPEMTQLNVMVTGPSQVVRPYLPASWQLTINPDAAHFFIGNTQMRTDLLVEGEVVGVVIRSGLPILIVKRLP